MNDRVERITALIDAALDGNDLQHTDEASYGHDHGPGVCWRCPAPAETPAGLCGPCRAWLLGDSDTDPAARTEPAERYTHRIEVDLDAGSTSTDQLWLTTIEVDTSRLWAAITDCRVQAHMLFGEPPEGMLFGFPVVEVDPDSWAQHI